MRTGIHARIARLTSTARTLGVVLLIAGSAAACSSDQAGADGPNPGLAFDGRYEVQYVSYDGQPYPPNQPTTTLDARTSCDGDSGPCVTTVVQGPVTTLLDFRDGSWQGVAENPPVPCTATATGEVLGEAPVIARLTVTPQSAGSDVLVLDTLNASPSPCTASHTATALLRRTGDADPAVSAPSTDVPAVTTSPGMAMSGEYHFAATPADNPDSGPDPRFSENWTFTPLCTRDGGLCVAVGRQAGGVVTVHSFSDGQWVDEHKASEAQCSANPTSTKRTMASGHTELTRTDNGPDDTPAQSLSGLQIWTFDGDCPQTLQFTLQATRIGD